MGISQVKQIVDAKNNINMEMLGTSLLLLQSVNINLFIVWLGERYK